MMQTKFYTTFSFFKILFFTSFLIVIGIWLLFFINSEKEKSLFELQVIILASLILLLSIIIFRTIQLIYSLEQNRTYDLHQVEAWMWIYTKYKPSFPLPPSRDFAASPDFLKWLLYIIEERKPQVVLEAGSGLSTIILADYYTQNNMPVTHFALENNEAFRKQTQSWIKNDNVHILYAPLKKYQLQNSKKISWYDLYEIEKRDIKNIDLLIIDGPHALKEKEVRYPALPLLHNRLSKTTAILADDTKRPEDRAIMEAWAKEGGFTIQYFNTEKGACLLTRN